MRRREGVIELRPRKIAVVAIAAFIVALAPAAPAAAQDTSAVAINTKDGSSLFRFAFQVKRVATDVVTTSNAAVAVASCTDCQTVAVSLQIVLITSDPSVVTPENVAVALNVDCTLCQTMASAHQYVISTGGPVRFTDEGNRILAGVRQAFADLSRSAEGMTLDQIAAAIGEITTQVEYALANELVPADDEDEEGDEEGDEEEGDEEAEDDAASPAAEPSPPAAASASPTPTVTASAATDTATTPSPASSPTP